MRLPTVLQPVRRRLPLLICALLLAVVAVFSWIAFRRFERALLVAGGERVGGASQRLASVLEEQARRGRAEWKLGPADSAVERYLRSRGSHHASRAGELLARRLASGSQRMAIQLRGVDGGVLLSVGAVPGSTTGEPRRSAAAADSIPRGGYTGPFASVGDTVYYAQVGPVVAARGDTIGYFAQYHRISASPRAPQFLSGLIGADATLAVGNVQGGAWTDLTGAVPAPAARLEFGRPMVMTGRGGEPALGVATRIQGTPWVVAVALPRRDLLAPARELLGTTLWLAAIVLALGALGAWALSRQITGPLTEMTRAAEGIAAGDYSQRVTAEWRADELGRLAGSFNSMARQVDEATNELQQQMEQLQEQATELEHQTEQLQEQAVELEQQTEQAQALAQQLEASNEELSGALAEAEAAREALGAERRFLRQVIDAIPNFVFVKDRAGRFALVNQAVADVYGTTVEGLLGKTDADFNPNAAEVEAFRRDDLAVMDSGLTKVIPEEVVTDASGARRWVQTVKRPLGTADGPADQILGVSTDLTDRKRAEEQLRASEERHRLLFERNPFPMWLFDAETLAILAVNDAAVDHYGYSREEFLAMRVTDLRPAEDVPQMLASRAAPGSGRSEAGLHRHRKKDGKLITVEVISDDGHVAGRPARLVLARDVTEREALEAQLRQSQKMEAVGQLAGGVAHDFNNLLTVITSYSEMLLEKLNPGNPDRSDLEEIKHAASRAAGLTRQLLAFSRKQVIQPRVLDLNADVIAGIEKMLRRLIGEDIELVTSLEPMLGLINADPGQLEQVIVNLAVNARDAMPNGGRLVIETANAELGADDAGRHIGVQPGRYVMLSVSDTGSGMSRETMARMFEPFFTTKEQGRGTGLGLSTVYGIVKQSGGDIWVYSEPGQGTTFKVYLPRVEAAVTEAASVSPRQLEHGVGETILLVEDEDALRALAKKILVSRGYTVLEARNGEEALSLCERPEPRIDLVLTDAVMPGMSGRALAERLGALRPDARVLLMSGYTDDDMLRRGILDPRMAFLQKPFTPGALAKKVREVLDGEPPAAAPDGAYHAPKRDPVRRD